MTIQAPDQVSVNAGSAVKSPIAIRIGSSSQAWFHCAILSLVLLFNAQMQTVKLAPNKKGFVLHPSGERYIPWGHNYGSVDIMVRMSKEPDRVERDFAAMKAAGTTVARVHPEMPAFFLGPDKINPQAIQQLTHLLKIAEKSGIRLMITGLACYQIKDRMAWYDALADGTRWNTQEFFWATIAKTCANSPAVFAYDLVNEPGAVGTRSEGWHLGPQVREIHLGVIVIDGRREQTGKR